MEGHQFDQIAKEQGASGSRRRALKLLAGGLLAPVLAHFGRQEAAAACRTFNQPCGKNAPCCPGHGIRCQDGRCTCRPEKTHCVAGPRCQDLGHDPAHCGKCGKSCPATKPCCVKGKCRPKCGDSCCDNCFIELLPNGVPIPNSHVCCRGAAGTVCGKQPGRHDDRCCYPDELCLKGRCCSNSLYGTTNCKGTCCAKAACCNGTTCCRKDFVCARQAGTGKEICVRANRGCTVKGHCYANEICHGGVCCAGGRICQTNFGADPLCCKANEYCEFGNTPNARCSRIHTSQSTSRGHRIRP